MVVTILLSGVPMLAKTRKEVLERLHSNKNACMVKLTHKILGRDGVPTSLSKEAIVREILEINVLIGLFTLPEDDHVSQSSNPECKS